MDEEKEDVFSQKRLDALKVKANEQYTTLATTLKEMDDVVNAFQADSVGFVKLSKEYALSMKDILSELDKPKF